MKKTLVEHTFQGNGTIVVYDGKRVVAGLEFSPGDHVVISYIKEGQETKENEMLTRNEISDLLDQAACDAWNDHNRIMEALEKGDTKMALMSYRWFDRNKTRYHTLHEVLNEPLETMEPDLPADFLKEQCEKGSKTEK